MLCKNNILLFMKIIISISKKLSYPNKSICYLQRFFETVINFNQRLNNSVYKRNKIRLKNLNILCRYGSYEIRREIQQVIPDTRNYPWTPCEG